MEKEIPGSRQREELLEAALARLQAEYDALFVAATEGAMLMRQQHEAQMAALQKNQMVTSQTSDSSRPKEYKGRRRHRTSGTEDLVALF